MRLLLLALLCLHVTARHSIDHGGAGVIQPPTPPSSSAPPSLTPSTSSASPSSSPAPTSPAHPATLPTNTSTTHEDQEKWLDRHLAAYCAVHSASDYLQKWRAVLNRPPADTQGRLPTLKQVQVIIRHGDRVNNGSCWAHDSLETMTCRLQALSAAMAPKPGAAANDDGEDDTHRLLFRKMSLKRHDAFGASDCRSMQLTSRGFHQQVLNGQVLREAYITEPQDKGHMSNPLLLPTFTTMMRDKIFLRSDDISRTIHSVEGLFQGLYPEEDSARQVVDIHVVNLDQDNLFPNPGTCPRLKQLEHQFYHSESYKDFKRMIVDELAKVASPLFHNGSDSAEPLADLHRLFDCFHVHSCHHLPMEHALASMKDYHSYVTHVVKAIEKATDDLYNFEYNPGVTYASLAMSSLVSELYKAMADALSPKVRVAVAKDTATNLTREIDTKDVEQQLEQLLGQPTPSTAAATSAATPSAADTAATSAPLLLVYSGHDDTIMPFLSAFNVSDGAWAPYASMVILELYETDSSAAVRLLYNGVALHVPGCDSELCEWSQFSAVVERLVQSPQDCTASRKVYRKKQPLRTLI